jgi:hypothetical protein
MWINTLAMVRINAEITSFCVISGFAISVAATSLWNSSASLSDAAMSSLLDIFISIFPRSSSPQ